MDVATPPAQEAQGEEHEPEEADPTMSSPEYGDRGESSADEEDMIGCWQLTQTAEKLLLKTYALLEQHPGSKYLENEVDGYISKIKNLEQRRGSRSTPLPIARETALQSHKRVMGLVALLEGRLMLAERERRINDNPLTERSVRRRKEDLMDLEYVYAQQTRPFIVKENQPPTSEEAVNEHDQASKEVERVEESKESSGNSSPKGSGEGLGEALAEHIAATEDEVAMADDKQEEQSSVNVAGTIDNKQEKQMEMIGTPGDDVVMADDKQKEQSSVDVVGTVDDKQEKQTETTHTEISDNKQDKETAEAPRALSDMDRLLLDDDDLMDDEQSSDEEIADSRGRTSQRLVIAANWRDIMAKYFTANWLDSITKALWEVRGVELKWKEEQRDSPMVSTLIRGECPCQAVWYWDCTMQGSGKHLTLRNFKDMLREIVGVGNVAPEVCDDYVTKLVSPHLCTFGSDAPTTQMRFRAAMRHVLTGAEHLDKMATRGMPTLTKESLARSGKEQRELLIALMHAVFERGSPSLRAAASGASNPPRRGAGSGSGKEPKGPDHARADERALARPSDEPKSSGREHTSALAPASTRREPAPSGVCRFFMQKGYCRFGRDCRFRHERGESNSVTSGSGLLGKARGDRAGKYNQDSCYYSLKNSGDGFQSSDEVEPSLTEATQERHAQISSPGRTLRERQASLADLPTKAERCKVYMGSDTWGFRIAECTWSPRDGCIGAGWLLQWLTPREIQTATLPVILTFFDNHGHWLAWTIAMESESLPGQYGLIAARDFGEGDTLGFMRDGHIADFERGSAALHAAVAERVSSGGDDSSTRFLQPARAWWHSVMASSHALAGRAQRMTREALLGFNRTVHSWRMGG